MENLQTIRAKKNAGVTSTYTVLKAAMHANIAALGLRLLNRYIARVPHCPKQRYKREDGQYVGQKWDLSNGMPSEQSFARLQQVALQWKTVYSTHQETRVPQRRRKTQPTTRLGLSTKMFPRPCLCDCSPPRNGERGASLATVIRLAPCLQPFSLFYRALPPRPAGNPRTRVDIVRTRIVYTLQIASRTLRIFRPASEVSCATTVVGNIMSAVRQALGGSWTTS